MSATEATVVGPVQLLVVSFEGDHFTGEIMKELHRLSEHDVIRVIDLLAIRRDEDGTVEKLQESDLEPEQAAAYGAALGELIGLDTDHPGHMVDEEDVFYVADAIEPGTTAGAVLLEHRWALGLRGAVERANGTTLVDAWVHREDLTRAGVGAG